MANPAGAVSTWPGFLCSRLGHRETLRQRCLRRFIMHAVIRKYTGSLGRHHRSATEAAAPRADDAADAGLRRLLLPRDR